MNFKKKLLALVVIALLAYVAYFFYDSSSESVLPPPPSISTKSSDVAGSLTAAKFWKFKQGEEYVSTAACPVRKVKQEGVDFDLDGNEVRLLSVYSSTESTVQELMGRLRNNVDTKSVILHYDSTANKFYEFKSEYYVTSSLNVDVFPENYVVKPYRPVFVISPKADEITFCRDTNDDINVEVMPSDYWDIVYLPSVAADNKGIIFNLYDNNIFDGSDAAITDFGEAGIYRVGLLASDLEPGSMPLCFGSCQPNDFSAADSPFNPKVLKGALREIDDPERSVVNKYLTLFKADLFEIYSSLKGRNNYDLEDIKGMLAEVDKMNGVFLDGVNGGSHLSSSLNIKTNLQHLRGENSNHIRVNKVLQGFETNNWYKLTVLASYGIFSDIYTTDDSVKKFSASLTPLLERYAELIDAADPKQVMTLHDNWSEFLLDSLRLNREILPRIDLSSLVPADGDGDDDGDNGDDDGDEAGAGEGDAGEGDAGEGDAGEGDAGAEADAGDAGGAEAGDGAAVDSEAASQRPNADDEERNDDGGAGGSSAADLFGGPRGQDLLDAITNLDRFSATGECINSGREIKWTVPDSYLKKYYFSTNTVDVLGVLQKELLKSLINEKTFETSSGSSNFGVYLKFYKLVGKNRKEYTGETEVVRCAMQRIAPQEPLVPKKNNPIVPGNFDIQNKILDSRKEFQ